MVEVQHTISSAEPDRIVCLFIRACSATNRNTQSNKSIKKRIQTLGQHC
jgi:hypothetical protein